MKSLRCLRNDLQNKCYIAGYYHFGTEIINGKIYDFSLIRKNYEIQCIEKIRSIRDFLENKIYEKNHTKKVTYMLLDEMEIRLSLSYQRKTKNIIEF